MVCLGVPADIGVKGEKGNSKVTEKPQDSLQMKFVLILSLLPLIGVFLVRKFFCDRVLKKYEGERVSLTGKELAKRILKNGSKGPVEIEIKTRPFMILGPDRLVLSTRLADSIKAKDVAEVGLMAGMVLMAQRQSNVVGWRLWAIKSGTALPVFVALVAPFAMFFLRVINSITFVVLSLAFSAIILALTTAVERAAAEAVSGVLMDSAIVPRQTEGETLARLVKALSWKRIVPGAISWLGR